MKVYLPCSRRLKGARLAPCRRWAAPGRLGFTVIEMLIGSTAGLFVTGIALVLLVESAKEERRGLADATVEQYASSLEGKIVQILRTMSASQGVAFSSPARDSSGRLLGYQSVIMGHGPAPDFPREEVRFDPATGSVVYDPDRAVADNELTLASRNNWALVRQVLFTPSLKPDGTVDNALVNVVLHVDDGGASHRAENTPNPASIWRTVSVRMRND